MEEAKVEEQKSIPENLFKKYIKSNCTKCLFCGSSNVDGKHGFMLFDEETGNIYKECYCYTCDREWTDVFTILSSKLMGE